MMVTFDFTINLTTMMGVAVWLVTLVVAWTKFGGRIDIIELRVSNMEQALRDVAAALKLLHANETSLAVLQTQIAALQKEQSTIHETVEGLRRGHGFIQGRGGIDGQYSRTDRVT